ncbi:MAG: GGDEF domain-containing protein [Pleomorphochaeta sp.]
MPKKSKNIVSLLNLTIISVYLLTVLFFIFTDDSIGMNLNRNDIISFNNGWTISYNGIVDETSILPQDFNLEPGQVYSIERIINEEDFIYPILRIRSSMMNVKAYIDDELIHSLDMNSSKLGLIEPYPASWQLINIPISSSSGKILKITFSSPTPHFSGLINSIMLGEGGAIILNLIQENFLNLVISTLIIFLSLFSLSSLFWIKNIGINKHILYLSSFGIAAGLWIISESTLLQLFISNRFLISSTSYILNLVLPLIIILFFRDVILEGFYKLLSFIAQITIFLLVLEFILQLSGKVSFISSTIYSIVLILITAIIILYCLIYEGFKKENIKARNYLLIFLALFVFAAIIMGLFIFGVYSKLEKFLSLGVFGFFLLVLSDAIESINELLETRNKSLMYKRLAFEDYLTKGWNRASFESDVDNLINQGISFRLVLLDLNHLKRINDTLGHAEGDYAIIESYNSLNISIGENGKSYRISGDEFACIIYDVSHDFYQKYTNQINEYLKDKSKNKSYDIILAYGSKIYNNKELFTSFYKTVDKKMYEHKQLLKNAR